ncbi:hypothetical protein [Candidatus Pantoea rara]|uniref:hypothetical protein n=1 Tax=Candidatus Pantoea rara TaxID=1947037 RepID=UPI003EB99A01
MNVTQVGEIHNCDCGFSWRTGKSGSHECGYGLRKQLAALKAERDSLAAEGAARGEIIERLIGQYSAAGYHAVQNSLNPAQSLLYDAMQVLKQSATDAYLNSVRAEGVEMFAKELGSPYGDDEGRDYETGFNRAIEVSKSKAAKFVTQLRAGKDGE